MTVEKNHKVYQSGEKRQERKGCGVIYPFIKVQAVERAMTLLNIGIGQSYCPLSGTHLSSIDVV